MSSFVVKFFRAAKNFILSISSDPDETSSFVEILRGQFSDPTSFGCDIPMETFDIDGASASGIPGRYLKLELVGYYGTKGLGLQYFQIYAYSS